MLKLFNILIKIQILLIGTIKSSCIFTIIIYYINLIKKISMSFFRAKDNPKLD